MAFDTFLPFTFKPDNVNVSVCELSSSGVNYTIPAGYYALVTVNMSSAIRSQDNDTFDQEGAVSSYDGIVHSKHHSFQFWLGEGDTIHLVKAADDNASNAYPVNTEIDYKLEVDITPNGGARTNAHIIHNRVKAKTPSPNTTRFYTQLFLSAITQEYALP
jgi:hypothetical protein